MVGTVKREPERVRLSLDTDRPGQDCFIGHVGINEVGDRPTSNTNLR